MASANYRIYGGVTTFLAADEVSSVSSRPHADHHHAWPGARPPRQQSGGDSRRTDHVWSSYERGGV